MNPQEIVDNIINYNIKSDISELQDTILLAEDTDFDIEQSKELYPCLLEYAIKYKDYNGDDCLYSASVYSAIRTSLSMVPIKDIFQIKDKIIELLKLNNKIDTRLVTIKMIGNIFAVEEPQFANGYNEIDIEIFNVAHNILQQKEICNKDFSILEVSIYALSGMASDKVFNIINNSKIKEEKWFLNIVKNNLYDLSEKWKNNKNYKNTMEMLRWIINLVEIYRNEN